MTVIEQIKAEIERLKEENNNIRCDYNKAYCQGYGDALVDLFSFLSTLESEKPMNLDEEIDNYFKHWTEDEYTGAACHYQYVNLNDCRGIARHFAKWVVDHTPLPEDTVLFNKGVAEGKRLMMEEAVKTRVIGLGLCDTPHVVLGLSDEFKDGDKVRIIIIKED